MRERPTFEEISEWLRYDPDTGLLFWKRSGKRRTKLKAAGYKPSSGYWTIKVNQYSTQYHRVCWLLSKGEWPVGEIDHINGNKSDNRIANLRDVTTSQNQANSKGKWNSKSGIKGVCISKHGITASICVKGKVHRLGKFNSVEMAAEAYRAASLEFFGDNSYFARDRRGT